MQIIVTKPFAYAHDGYRVEEFEPSDVPRETSDECGSLAVSAGWAKRAVAAAPENKDAAKQRSKKE